MELSMHFISRQRGFSLVEVMITAFIFATALMGAVAVQGVAKRSSYEAQQRTVASYIANDIIERLRLNKLWLLSSLSSGTYEVTGIGGGSLSAPGCTLAHGGMNGCSGSTLNQHDLFQWQELMLGAYVDVSGANFPVLSDPLGCIVIDATGLAGVMISWGGRDTEVDGAQVRLAQLDRINSTQLSNLLGAVANFVDFAQQCGISANDRHVYGMVTMIR